MSARRLATAALLASAIACGGRPEPPVAYLLARRAHLADHEGALMLLTPGTPRAEPFEVSGLFAAPYVAGDDPYAWSGRQAHFRVDLPGITPRFLVLDLEPLPRLEGQQVGVRFNDRRIGRVDVLAGRRRYVFDLPAEVQLKGRNTLTLRFRQASPARENGPRLSAKVYGLALGAAATTRYPDGSLPLLSVARDDGGSAILMSSGRLGFAVILPAAAELRFTPGTCPGSGDAELSVELETEDGSLSRVWHGRADGRPVVLTLPGRPGTPVRLTLVVESPRKEWAWAWWRNARVLGEPGRALLEWPTPDPKSLAEAAELRQRLGRPNVVLVVLDAARARQLGCYGYDRPTSPEIDRLAGEGVVFERAYTPAVFTLAAVSSIWTSLYPAQHHAGVPYDSPLPEDVPTLAERLTAAGVRNAGVSANGMAGRPYGLHRGFMTFTGLFRPQDASALADQLEAWLAGHADEAFFWYGHFREPHAPYDQPAPFDELFGQKDGPLPESARRDHGLVRAVNAGRRRLSEAERAQYVAFYDGGLAFADRHVGRIRTVLEEHGLLERTVFMITADHGEALDEHRFIGHNSQVWEEVTHVPLIVRLPGRLLAGSRVGELVTLLEIAPTVADLLGVDPAGPGVEGRSLLPVVVGGRGRSAVVSRAAGERSLYALRDARYKYVADVRYGYERLFDLIEDPGELDDIAGRAPVRTALYRQELWWHIATRRQGIVRTAAELRLSPADREQLKALGYIE